MLIINCKNYDCIDEKSIIKLSKIIKEISFKYKIQIIIAPPHHLLTIPLRYKIPVLAQHVDNIDKNNSTGFLILKSIKISKINGSLINHSEHRITRNDIIDLIQKIKKLNMISVVCVENVGELKSYLEYNPTYIAIEPKNLIGTNRSVTTENPEIIKHASNILENHKTKLLCGAGISSSNDVTKATELGANGVLVSSSIIKSTNWYEKINEFANAMFNNI